MSIAHTFALYRRADVGGFVLTDPSKDSVLKRVKKLFGVSELSLFLDLSPTLTDSFPLHASGVNVRLSHIYTTIPLSLLYHSHHSFVDFSLSSFVELANFQIVFLFRTQLSGWR